ncbi:btb (poz) domain-containing 2a-related [Anaeramoeba flamelloides]|uniref:Btb (Poz) domain-containing 2a-related n=1 Tax=Anaeramoeba flamelloides TaxID=1746091 RepID=A0ABQ8X0G7_9EUKA|nr:btb (poz) domain-containing 2a-related [Anaeramoeba flamelloides]
MDQVLGKYLNTDKFADVKFYIGKKKKEFYAHQLVLSLASPVWEEIFYPNKWEEQETIGMVEISLPDLDCVSFELFLEYAYKRRIDSRGDGIFKLYLFAEHYGMHKIKTYCSKAFLKNLNQGNCIEYYEYGKKMGINDWASQAMVYIEEHSDTILENENCFQKLSLETIKVVLGLEKLLSKEILIFKSLLKWAQYQKEANYKTDEKVTLKTLLSEFLNHIRLDLMSFQDLQLVNQTGLFSSEELLEYFIKLANNNKINTQSRSRGGTQLEDLKVLLLASCRGGEGRLEHIKESIMVGGIEKVTIINIETTTPSFTFIDDFDIVVLRGRNGSDMNNSTDLGNHLARFVESGKGLVVIAINTLINNESYRIKGRIAEEGFIPLAFGERLEQDQRQLGEIHLPEHPIMKGVQTFKTKDYTHVIGTRILNGGTLIASWDNGWPLITEKTKQEGYGTVVCLNFHPISTKITSDCGKAWLQETDGDIIISNSVQYVGLI